MKIPKDVGNIIKELMDHIEEIRKRNDPQEQQAFIEQVFGSPTMLGIIFAATNMHIDELEKRVMALELR